MKPFATLSLLTLALVARAADFNAEFNLSTNPGITGWTYGYTTSLGSSLNVYGSSFDSGINRIWYTPGLSNDLTPSVFKRYGAPGDGVATGEAGLHGGPGGQYSVARYTFTNAGTYSIVGAFGQGDIGNVDVFVRRGTNNLFSVLDTPNTASFSLTNQAFAAGESLDFIVGIAGNYTYDSTPLSATIQAVPEPASLATFGFGAWGLLRRRKRV